MRGTQVERQAMPLVCRRKERLLEVEAKNLAATLSRNSNEPMSAYRCRFCHHWHVGHPRKITDEPAVDQGIPKSQAEAQAEITRLKAESLSLKHALERISEDHSKQGWMKSQINLEAQLKVNRERTAFLKEFLTRQINTRTDSMRLAEKGFGSASSAFYEIGMMKFRDEGDSDGRKAFGYLFALANVEPENTDQIHDLQEKFRQRIEVWHKGRNGDV